MFKLWTNKNHLYKHNEQINNLNIDNFECFGVKYVNIYPEMTSQYLFGKNMVLVDYIGIFLHVAILLATYCRQWNEKQTIRYHTVKTIPKSNIKILERGTIDTPNAQIHDCSLFWLTCE